MVSKYSVLYFIICVYFLQANDGTDKNWPCASKFITRSCEHVSECFEQINNPELVFCSNGSVVNGCSNSGTGGCCNDYTKTLSSLLSFCKSTSQSHSQSTTIMTSITLSQSITSLSTESTATFLSNNLTTEATSIQTATQSTQDTTSIQTATQSTQNTTNINNLTIITISLGVILLLIVLTLVLICIILSVVLIVKRHHQFQPGKCHINNNS